VLLPVGVELDRDGDALVVRFRRPVDDGAVVQAARFLSDLMERESDVRVVVELADEPEAVTARSQGRLRLQLSTAAAGAG
jgi:hypothetical protein